MIEPYWCLWTKLFVCDMLVFKIKVEITSVYKVCELNLRHVYLVKNYHWCKNVEIVSVYKVYELNFKTFSLSEELSIM